MECLSSNERPMNAFLLFCKRHRSLVRKKYPNLEKRNVSRILGDWWHQLDDNEKRDFDKLANEYKQHVKRETRPDVRSKRQTLLVGGQKEAKNGTEVDENEFDNDSFDDDDDDDEEEAIVGSERRSSSSSPDLNSVASKPSGAPKPFKKRYLDAEKARSNGQESTNASLDAENACQALLQLAGVQDQGNVNVGSSTSSSDEASNDACTNNNGEHDSGKKKGHDVESSNGKKKRCKPEEHGRNEAGFHVLRDAVWNNVARTLMKQEEEKGSALNNQSLATKVDTNAPLNLSSQCLIRSQTIIEHVIENIIPEQQHSFLLDASSANANSSHSTDKGQHCSKEALATKVFNNNKYCVNSELAEEIKRSIYRGLKEDLSSDKSSSEGERIRGFLPEVQELIRIQEENEQSGNKKGRAASKHFDKKEKKPSAKEAPVEASSQNESKGQLGSQVVIVNHEPPMKSPTSKSDGCNTSATAVPSDVPLEKPFAGLSDEKEFCRRRESPNLKDILATSPKIGSRSVGSLSITVVPSSNPKRPAEPSPNSCDSVTVTPVKQKKLVTTATVTQVRSVFDDDEEDDLRRSSRSCKGKRYQEFRDEGIIVPKVSKVAASSNSTNNNTSVSGDIKRSHTPTRQGTTLEETNDGRGGENNNTQGFDIMSRLKAIPARDLEHYHKKLSKNRQNRNPNQAVNDKWADEKTEKTRPGDDGQESLSGQRRSSNRKSGSSSST